MRYYELVLEKETLGSKDEIQQMKTNRTFGFEFEVATNDNIDNELSRTDSFDDIIEQVKDEHPFEEWLFEGKFSDALEIVYNYKIKPIYDWAEEKNVISKQEEENPKYFDAVRKVIKKYFDEYDENASFEKKKNIAEEIFTVLHYFFKRVVKNYGINSNQMENIEKDASRTVQQLILSENTDYTSSLDRSLRNKIIELKRKLPEHHVGSDDIDNNDDEDEFDDDDIDYSDTHVVDSEGNIINLERVTSFDEFIKYFDRQDVEDVLKEDLYDEYMDYIETEASEIYNEKLQSSDYYFDNIAEIVKSNLNTEDVTPSPNYKGAKRGSNWIVEYDSSISPKGFELISPKIDGYNNAVWVINTVLSMIDNEDSFFTNDSTGLHINIGNIENVDLLKFILFIGEKYIGSVFNRFDTHYARSVIKTIKDEITNNDEIKKKPYNELIKNLNNIIKKEIPRESFINIKEPNNNKFILEIRGIGGKNYENKNNKIIEFLKRILFVLSISENPNAYKNEYLKKLSKFVDDETVSNFDILTKDEIEEFYKTVNKQYNKNNIKNYIDKLVNDPLEFGKYLKTLHQNQDTLKPIHKRILIKLFNNIMKNTSNFSRLHYYLENILIDDLKNKDAQISKELLDFINRFVKTKIG